jgi:alpha-methylacyl-CoA racemase
MTAPLDSTHVIDLSLLLPGPLTTQILRDLGAQVTKIEPTNGGDPLAGWPPLKGHQSAYYLALNRGKEVVWLDLKTPDGLRRFEQIVSTADVLVEGFRPGVLDRLNLGYHRLSQLNPRLVLCSISGFGQTGPLSNRAGHDLGYQAAAGALSLAGGDSPSNPALQVADTAGGAYAAAMLILAALLERNQTGRGRHLDVSMTEQLLPLMTMQFAVTDEIAGNPARDCETLTGGAPCYRIYRTRDDQLITLAALEPKFWRAAVERLGLSDLAEAPYLGGEGSAEMIHRLDNLFASKSLKEWTDLFRSTDACLEPVLKLSEVQSHPHWRARRSFLEIKAPDGSAIKVPKMPASLAGFQTEERNQ